MNRQLSFVSSPRNQLLYKYRNNCYNLLLVVIFSVINVILCVAGSESYFLFSATIPYLASVFGVAISIGTGATSMTFIGCAVAIILILPYLLCWIFSKRHYGWLIGALVYFAIDSVVLVSFLFSAPMIMDCLFHVWIIVSLIIGIVNGRKLKNMPEEELTDVASSVDENGDAIILEDTYPLRSAVTDEKIRVHIEADVEGRHIVYRKCGKCLEELVVDNMVYAEHTFKGRLKPHFMSAVVGGRKIEVGYYQMNCIVVDNVIIKQNTRWIA